MNDVQEIDVDELMAKIRANLPKQQHPPTNGASFPLSHSLVAAEFSSLQDSREIRYFHLTSHRKLLGSFVLMAKKLARKLLTPSLERQTGYNTTNIRLAQHLWEHAEGVRSTSQELVAQISELRQALTAQVAEIRQELGTQVAEIRQELTNQGREIRQELGTQVAEIRQELTNQGREIRQELGTQVAETRQELATQVTEVRHELTAPIAEIRQELGTQVAEIRHELATQVTEVRHELTEQHEQYEELAEQIGGVHQEQEAVSQAIRGELATQIGGVQQEQEAVSQAIRGELATQIGGVQQEQEAVSQAIRGELATQIGGVHQEYTTGLQGLQAQLVDEVTRVRQEHTVALQEMRERSSRVERRLRRFIAASTDGSNADVSETQPFLHHRKPISERTSEPSFDYFGFEERFRGSEEDIKERQSVYVEFFKDVEPVLDLGCGRGEFLELASEAGIEAKGVDLDLDMVLYCQEKGLDVAREDAFAYLESVPDASLGGIFAAQVVEHLEPTRIIELVSLCHRKLQLDGVLIFETPNPICLTVFARSFYMDLSHIRPIHPEAMKFLCESAGFKDLQVKFSSPVESSMRIPPLSDVVANAQATTEFNQGIERLNELLYGFQDYAVIGKKSSRL